MANSGLDELAAAYGLTTRVLRELFAQARLVDEHLAMEAAAQQVAQVRHALEAHPLPNATGMARLELPEILKSLSDAERRLLRASAA